MKLNFIIVFLFFLSFITFGNTREFIINDPGSRDTVHFVLDAPFEVINGNTNSVTGKLVFEKDTFSGTFEVPVNSIKTGIATRDEHLQNEKWLEAKKFPTLTLKLDKIKYSSDLWNGKSMELSQQGDFKIHGVTKKENIQMTLQYFKESEMTKKRLPGNLLRVKAQTSLKLSDYAIAQSDSKVKELIGLKVGEVARIDVDLMATDKKQP